MKTDKQDRYVAGVKRRLSQGLDLATASRRSAEESHGSRYRGSKLLKTKSIRKALGLDEPKGRKEADSLLLEVLTNAIAGTFPSWVGESPEARQSFYQCHINALYGVMGKGVETGEPAPDGR